MIIIKNKTKAHLFKYIKPKKLLKYINEDCIIPVILLHPQKLLKFKWYVNNNIRIAQFSIIYKLEQLIHGNKLFILKFVN